VSIMKTRSKAAYYRFGGGDPFNPAPGAPCQGQDLRDAENYLLAYALVSESNLAAILGPIAAFGYAPWRVLWGSYSDSSPWTFSLLYWQIKGWAHAVSDKCK
jgi:hypothetical protein